jgi:hypothetical protein
MIDLAIALFKDFGLIIVALVLIIGGSAYSLFETDRRAKLHEQLLQKNRMLKNAKTSKDIDSASSDDDYAIRVLDEINRR